MTQHNHVQAHQVSITGLYPYRLLGLQIRGSCHIPSNIIKRYYVSSRNYPLGMEYIIEYTTLRTDDEQERVRGFFKISDGALPTYLLGYPIRVLPKWETFKRCCGT